MAYTTYSIRLTITTGHDCVIRTLLLPPETAQTCVVVSALYSGAVFEACLFGCLGGAGWGGGGDDDILVGLLFQQPPVAKRPKHDLTCRSSGLYSL